MQNKLLSPEAKHILLLENDVGMSIWRVGFLATKEDEKEYAEDRGYHVIMVMDNPTYNAENNDYFPYE